MWEPRLKSQRVKGREREAGREVRRGVSKRERVAMAPEERREVVMLVVRMRVLRDIVGGVGVYVAGRFVMGFWIFNFSLRVDYLGFVFVVGGGCS